MKGRKRHGGRRANRGTPVSRYSVGQPPWICGLVRKWRRRFGAAWYTNGARVTVEGGESALACDVYDTLAHGGRGTIAAGMRRSRVAFRFTVVDEMSGPIERIIAAMGEIEASLSDEQRHRIRCDMRYDREIADARARNMPDTAAAIEAERAEWLASAGSPDR